MLYTPTAHRAMSVLLAAHSAPIEPVIHTAKRSRCKEPRAPWDAGSVPRKPPAIERLQPDSA
jgi:hypothetical protein